MYQYLKFQYFIIVTLVNYPVATLLNFIKFNLCIQN